jgi:NitT/TauT family transport system permease protein
MEYRAGGMSSVQETGPPVGVSPAGTGTRVADSRLPPVQDALRVLLPLAVLVLLYFVWEYGVQLFRIPEYSLPTPSTIAQTLPTIDELKTDTYFTLVKEALPGFLFGCSLGFLAAVLATKLRFFARGIIPYAVISNSIPIIGIAPIAISLFGDDWQSKAVIVGILTFFPMLINAYQGLNTIDPLSQQLMRSYAARDWEIFLKLRIPASLPYVFNGFKINTTLAIIGAIVGEYFGGPTAGLGYFIHNQSGEPGHTPELWSAVVIACVAGVSLYLIVVALERMLTSWHISYRAGR